MNLTQNKKTLNPICLTPFPFASDVKDDATSSNIQLGQNYPNPANEYTSIYFSLTNKGTVSIDLLDIMGRKIKTIFVEKETIGQQKVDFSVADLSSGIYIYQMRTQEGILQKKITVIH